MTRSGMLLLPLALLSVLIAGVVHADDAANDGKLRIIAFGAHPDDAEFQMGGAAIKWAKLGHHVKLVSVTNGDLGHWDISGGPLAIRRTKEVQEAARRMGTTVEVLDIHDGELMPTLENRKTIIRLIREWKADLVLAPGPMTTIRIIVTRASWFRMRRSWWRCPSSRRTCRR